MSRQTFLPSGMGGVIVCPVQADPPLLYVNWTKDGNNINVDNVCLKRNMFVQTVKSAELLLNKRRVPVWPGAVPRLDGELRGLRLHHHGQRQRCGHVHLHCLQQLRHHGPVGPHPGHLKGTLNPSDPTPGTDASLSNTEDNMEHNTRDIMSQNIRDHFWICDTTLRFVVRCSI